MKNYKVQKDLERQLKKGAKFARRWIAMLAKVHSLSEDARNEFDRTLDNVQVSLGGDLAPQDTAKPERDRQSLN